MHFSTFGAASIQVWNCPKPAKPVKLVWHMHSDHERTLRVSQDVSNTNKHWNQQQPERFHRPGILAAFAFNKRVLSLLPAIVLKTIAGKRRTLLLNNRVLLFSAIVFKLHTMFPTSSGNSGLLRVYVQAF